MSEIFTGSVTPSLVPRFFLGICIRGCSGYILHLTPANGVKQIKINGMISLSQYDRSIKRYAPRYFFTVVEKDARNILRVISLFFLSFFFLPSPPLPNKFPR